MLLSQGWNQGTVCANAPSWCRLDSWTKFALNDGTKVFIYAFSIVNGFQVSVLNMSSCEGVLLHLNLKHMEKNT